jgi:hypothetical protein
VDLGEIKQYLHRAEWRDFPDVLICVDEPTATRHPLYPPAKIGDAKAADALVVDLLSDTVRARIAAQVAGKRPHLLAVHALEAVGMNAIPRVLARKLAQEFDLHLESGIVQLNRVTHTKADGYHRLAFPAVFEGALKEEEYILVDDFVGQGGTLANLRGHVEFHGGRVTSSISLGKRPIGENESRRRHTSETED